MLVHLHDVAAALTATKAIPERRASLDDRVHAGVGLDAEALSDLGLEECRERRLALSKGIDVAGHVEASVIPPGAVEQTDRSGALPGFVCFPGTDDSRATPSLG
jgi:hypothetical protein